MRVSPRGDLFFEDPAFEADGDLDEIVPPAEISEANVFLLHSKPGAANILYLDFDGHDVTGTVWNDNAGVSVLNMRPYSTDSDYANFSTSEIDRIAESWRRVAEDFAPFDIDVTTEDPGASGSNVGHILVTQKQDASGDYIYNCSCGGVAYYNGFGSSYLSPGLVFNTSLTGVAEAASHEFGHNLNLNHDGTSGSSYYSGHGSGAVSWGPIMGASYNRNVTQFSKGEYSGANNQQDDLAIIAGELSYRVDDHEDSILGLATPLLITGGTNVVSFGRVSDPSATDLANRGIIEDRNDFDLFSMNVGTGTINLTISPAHLENYTGSYSSNLDIEARLLDEFGNVVQTSSPDTDTSATINYNVTIAGAYYLEINGVGRGAVLSDGYTDYASVGEFFINGTVPPDTVITDPPVAPADLTATLVNDVNIELNWTDPASPAEADEDGYRVRRSVDGGPFVLRATLARDSNFFADNNLANGDYAYQLEVFNSVDTALSPQTAPISIDAPSVAVATSEATTSGSILSGSYVSTQNASGSETLVEQHSGGKPQNRRSYLDHTWTVTGVVPGATVDLEVRASAPSNSENEDFDFTYSVNNGPWLDLGTVPGGGTAIMSASLPPSTSGSVRIKVVDSDPNTVGNKNTDTVSVQEISITSGGDAGNQPPFVTIVAPADGTLVMLGEETFFEGTADDEDGDLKGSLTWTSDLVGPIGNGANPSAVLTLGTHTVTASVDDSAAQTGDDSITVTVSDTPQSTTMAISDLDGASAPAGRGGKWQATVSATVLDNLGNPVSGATVSGSWSSGASGSGSCLTDASGSCDISKGGLKSNASSARFTVTGISHASLSYNSSANDDPDTDSDGTVITVAAP
ncbi:MAG: hypothetical protein HKN28_08750 [Alphaproteobacteria bacterium]|nr:hypothetical protein [Alphaproteobacteria bacterium]